MPTPIMSIKTMISTNSPAAENPLRHPTSQFNRLLVAISVSSSASFGGSYGFGLHIPALRCITIEFMFGFGPFELLLFLVMLGVPVAVLISMPRRK